MPVCAALSLLAVGDLALAQRGGRGGGSGRGGFGGGDSVLTTLGQEEVQQELGLTAEQKTRLTELQTQAQGGRDAMAPYFEKLREAETEEDRAKVRAEMETAGTTLREQAEAAARKLLNPAQMKTLAARTARDRGPRAIFDPLVRDQLGLSAAQTAKLDTLSSERSEARRALGYRATAEETAAFDEEWNAKTLAALDEKQRANFATLAVPAAPTGAAKSPATTAAPVARAAAPIALMPTPSPQPVGDGEALASFGTPPATAAPQPAGAEQGREEPSLSFNFRYAPWADVLMLFADRAGLTLDLNRTPAGTFNYRDNRSYTPTQALDVLNGYLLQKGFVLVRRDNFLVCLNLDDGIPPNLVPNVSREELERRGNNELLSVIFPVGGATAAEVAKEVEQLLGPQGRIAALGATNSLVVTDIGSNLRRIGKLLDAAAAARPGDLVFKSHPVKHLSPDEAAQIVRGQLGISSGTTVTNVSEGAYDAWRRERDRTKDSSPQTAGKPAAPAASVSPDARTGSLLVTATAGQQVLVEQILLAVDVPGSGTAATGRRSTEPFLKVYTLTGSDAGEVVKTLDVLMPGVVVNEDGRNRKIHIFAPEAVHEEVATLIRQLDGGTNATGQAVTVIPLSTLDPYGAASTLRALFSGDGDSAPVIEADSFGRRLMIRGTSDQVLQVKTLLAQLGEDGSGAKPAAAGGTVRTIPLGGRDPEELLPLLERLWEASEGEPLRRLESGPGRLIERRRLGSRADQPSAGGAAFNVADHVAETSSAGEPSATEPSATEPSATEPSVRQPLSGGSVPTEPSPAESSAREAVAPKSSAREPSASATPAAEPSAAGTSAREDSVAGPSAGEGAAAGTSAPASSAARTSVSPTSVSPASASRTTTPAASESNGPPVALTVRNGNLVLASEDEEALDRMEDLVLRLGQVVPPRTKWTVFYLQSADVTEAATLIEQIFPSSSVSMTSDSGGLLGSLTSGISSLGGDLMNVAGLDGLGASDQTLRIIPDIRSNSMFVSGPADKVAEIEQVLEVLDTSDLPDTLRDRVPRMIPVRHAEVEEVAGIVREVYKDAINPAAAAGAGNPLAALLAGGGGGKKGGAIELPPTRMSVGVDARTSNLVVSADDALFRQVEELVESLDKAALDAQRTVRVVTLENGDAAMFSQAIGSLLPKVRVSTTGERRSPSPASNGAAGSNGSSTANDAKAAAPQQSSSQDQEQVRRFFEERMKERMQQGGAAAGGGAPSARPSGGFGGGSRGSRSGRSR